MDIDGANFITLTLYTNDTNNEIADFNDIIAKCCIESNKPGLRNMFSKSERDLINALADELNITIEKNVNIIQAGDTHTTEQNQQYSDESNTGI